MLGQAVGRLFLTLVILPLIRVDVLLPFVRFLRFSERRAQKAAQAADARAKGGQPPTEDSLTDDDASAEDELDSDDGSVDGPEPSERRRLKAPVPTEPRLSPLSVKKHRLVDSADNRLGPPWPAASSDATTSSTPLRKIQVTRAIRPKGKYETDGIASVESGTAANKLSRRLILGLADLDSVHGRCVILVLLRILFKKKDVLTIPFFFSFV